MKEIFLDAGYIIALEAADDQNHHAAFEHWRNFRRSLPPIITTDYVFDEIVTFFNSRNRHEKAVEIGNKLLQSATVELIRVDEELFNEGWAFFQKQRDKRYSLTDCISFTLMRQRGITEALSFDKHFAQAGFEKLPPNE